MDGVRNATGQEDRDTGLWNLDYLITCFAEEKICVSFGLWLLSCLFWFTSFSLHFYLRCKRKSRHEESIFWNIYSFFGSMCNAIGSLLAKQLTIQVITGAYMALSDVIDFILTLFPVCTSSYRVRASHQPSRRKRHRKPVLSALTYCVMISLGYYSLYVRAPLLPEVSHGPQRKLLESVLQERIDVVGFTLGIIAVLVSWTVRVPVITKVCKGMVFPVIQVWAVLFSALASIMYAAAIMSHDRHQEYYVRAIPWFLISMGTAALDVALMFLSCMMKNKLIQQMGPVMDVTLDDESCKLVAHMEESKPGAPGGLINIDKERLHWTPLNMLPNRSLNTGPSLGHYMKLRIQQVQEDGVGAVRLPGDGQTNPGTIHNKEPLRYLDLPRYPPTCISHYSSSSSDRSSNTTDLEWDFEDLDQNWNTDSEVPSIQPSDSSVLNVASCNSELQFTSTLWPR
ncbi:transmembrane protein 44 isoform X1 [Rana temporaria]|uniref:transmembrane protein 44 isoform X1 n=2 Tax=Rana temporaria TaxID=8407 RepID=UPI001AAC9883|nr:transmembrane protein 44 isoform X1 [Rana temporaria]